MKFILIIFVIFVITKVCVTTNVKTVKQKLNFNIFVSFCSFQDLFDSGGVYRHVAQLLNTKAIPFSSKEFAEMIRLTTRTTLYFTWRKKIAVSGPTLLDRITLSVKPMKSQLRYFT